MKHKELKTINKDTIKEKLIELKRELIKYRAQSSAGAAMENPGKIRNIRKSIAQLETIKKGGKEKK